MAVIAADTEIHIAVSNSEYNTDTIADITIAIATKSNTEPRTNATVLSKLRVGRLPARSVCVVIP